MRWILSLVLCSLAFPVAAKDPLKMTMQFVIEDSWKVSVYEILTNKGNHVIATVKCDKPGMEFEFYGDAFIPNAWYKFTPDEEPDRIYFDEDLDGYYCEYLQTLYVYTERPKPKFDKWKTERSISEIRRDANGCQEAHDEFNWTGVSISSILYKADMSTHQDGFISHFSYLKSKTWLTSYLAEGSEMFYTTHINKSANDCHALKRWLNRGMMWMFRYIAHKDPQCRQKYAEYKVCD